MSRSCGDCRLCCKLMHVAEKGTIDGEPYLFTHYPGSWCKHVVLGPGDRGCSLHDTKRKPLACRTFRCLWLMGEGEEEDRPDKIKVVVALEPRSGTSDLNEAPGPDEIYLMIYEGAPHAQASKKAQRFLNHVAALFQTHDFIRAFEIVPFGKPWEDRLCNHKDKGPHTIRLLGWPEPLDADAEREAMEAVFGPNAELLTIEEKIALAESMSDEERDAAVRVLADRIAGLLK